MLLEQILECSAATLEAMSDAQLHEHFKEFLNVTRPDSPDAIYNEHTPREKRARRMSGAEQKLLALSPEKRKMIEQAMADSGMKIEELI